MLSCFVFVCLFVVVLMVLFKLLKIIFAFGAFSFDGSTVLSVESAPRGVQTPHRALPEVPVWVMRKALASGMCGIGCA